MKRSPVWFIVTVCTTLAVTGCKKKEVPEARVVRDGEQKLPAGEQMEPAPTTSGAPSTITVPSAASDAAYLGTSAPGTNPAGAGAPPITATAAPAGADQAAYEAWFKKYNLNLNDPKMLDDDPDEDGFTNRDEFLADTDPHDKNSRPGIHKGIRLKEYSEVRLPLTLESIEGNRAQIKRTDQPDAKPVTIKAGDTVHGLPLRVVRVEEKEDYDKGGEKVNFSKVEFEDTSTKEKVYLRKDLPARTSATFAVLVSPDGKYNLKVRKDDVFTWPAENASHYKVIDLSQDQVVLLEIETKKTWTIPRL